MSILGNKTLKYAIGGAIVGGIALMLMKHFNAGKAMAAHSYAAHNLGAVPYVPDDPRAFLGWRQGHDPGHDNAASDEVLYHHIPTTVHRIGPPPPINFHNLPVTGSFNKQTNGFTTYW